MNELRSARTGPAWRCEHCGEPCGEATATCPECLDLEHAICDAARLYIKCRMPARLNALADANAAYERAARRPCPTCGEALEAAEDREAGAHRGACLSAERLSAASEERP